MPCGHGGPTDAARDRTVQVAIGRQGARGRRSVLEDAEGEVAWTRREEGRGRAVAVAVLPVTSHAPGVVDPASERQEIRAARDVHDRHADHLRLEYLAPGATVGAELLDVSHQADQLLRGDYQGDRRERGRPFAEGLEVDDGRALARAPPARRRREQTQAPRLLAEPAQRLRP